MKQNLLKTFKLRVLMLVAILCAGFTNAWGETVTYTVSSTKAVTTSGTAPSGSSASYSQTYGTKCQMTRGNSATLTLAGFNNLKITNITLSAHSNSSAGSGSFSYSIDGGTTFTDIIATNQFKHSSWHGSWSSAYVDVSKDVNITPTDGTVVLKIEATVNSLFCESYTITYEPVSTSAVATTTTIDDTGITNTDVYAGTTAGSLAATVSADGTAISGASVTWHGNNDNVATINASTGAVTLVAAGSVTFTASYAGVSGQYQASSDTYEMTVTSSAPYVQPTTVEITPNYTFWGKTAQFSGNDFSELSGSQDNVDLSWSKGEGSTYANTTAMRFYKDNELTFTAPDGYEIKSIVLSVSGSYSDLSFAPTGYDNETTTWTGSSKTVTMSRPSNASSYATISKFTITIGLPSTDPSISADDVEIAYNATSGSVLYTITNPDAGTTLTASTTASWLTVGTPADGTIALTCTANSETTARMATVTLTYGTLTKEVTVTQAAAPLIYSTIPALFEAATSTETAVNVTFNNWVVSGVSTNGKNVFVTDNAGNGFVIYSNENQSSTYSVGSILSGTAVPCTLKKYNGFAELLNVNATNLTITTGGTVAVQNIALADLTGLNTGALVSYSGLTCEVTTSTNNGNTYTNYDLSDGTTTIRAFTTLYDFTTNEEIVDGNTYNITGIYQQYNTTKEILPRSAGDIEEVAIPSITVDPTTIEVDSEGEEGGISVVYDNVETDDIEIIFYTTAEATTTTTCSWVDAIFDEMNNVQYTIAANEGEARTAYMKVHGLDSNGDDVYSELITISQAAQVTPVTGSNYVKVTSTDDLTSGQYLIVYEEGSVAFNGGLTTLDASGNTIEVTINDGEIAATTETTAAEFTLDVTAGTIKSASGFYIGRTADSNGMNSSATEAYTNTISIDTDGNADISSGGAYLRYNSNSDQKRFRYFKSSSYTGQKAIQLYKKVEAEQPITLTVGDAGYTTYVTPAAVSFPVGVEAFIVTAINEGSMHMEAVTAVPANTPIVVKAAAGTYELIEYAEEPNDVSANLLQASDGKVKGGSNIYVLANKSKGVGFYPTATTITIPAGKAYLDTSATGHVKEFIAFDFGGTDAINAIDNGQLTVDSSVIYNVAGQRVGKMTKGIYVVNGKKVIVK